MVPASCRRFLEIVTRKLPAGRRRYKTRSSRFEVLLLMGGLSRGCFLLLTRSFSLQNFSAALRGFTDKVSHFWVCRLHVRDDIVLAEPLAGGGAYRDDRHARESAAEGAFCLHFCGDLQEMVGLRGGCK